MRAGWHESLADFSMIGMGGIGSGFKDYDPDKFDVFPIEVALGRIAARRNAAAKRIINTKNR